VVATVIWHKEATLTASNWKVVTRWTQRMTRQACAISLCEYQGGHMLPVELL